MDENVVKFKRPKPPNKYEKVYPAIFFFVLGMMAMWLIDHSAFFQR
jgi:hypothetical protein